MVRFQCRLLGAMLLMGLAVPVGAASPTLTLLVGSQNAPKMFLSQAGEPIGYFTEMSQAIVQRAGFKPDTVAMPWARALYVAEQGRGVIASLSMTPEREKIFSYSEPIVEDRIVIVTMKKSARVASSLADLKGLRVGFNRGSRYGPKFVAELPLVDAQEDDSTVQRLKKLAAGRIDAAIVYGGQPAVQFNALQAGVAMVDLTVQPTPLALDKNYLAIAKSRSDGPEIIKKLNHAIAAMKADGTLVKILKKWGAVVTP